MKYILLILGVLLLSAGACTSSKSKKTKVIGISQSSMDDAWRQAMIRDMQIELSNYDDIELEIRDAGNNNLKQTEQIQELIDKGVDVLIVSPFESQPLSGVVAEAYKRGIPVIITDRKVNTDRYTTFIGANNYEIGYDAGLYAAEQLKTKGKEKHPRILEIWGLDTSSPAHERHQGFLAALATNGIAPIIDSIPGSWRHDSAAVRLNGISEATPFDLVFSHNDEMGIAASEYFKLHNISRPVIVGVDATAGAGLEAVADGRIDASVLYPTGGEEVVRTAKAILEGQSVPKEIRLPTARINQKTAVANLIQNQRLVHYRDNIVQKKEKLNLLTQRFSFLESSLWVILLLLVVVIVLSGFIVSSYRKIKRANRELTERNRREEEQSRKLVALNTEIEKATAQKLQFFTNVSHEIRTPLTLILAPLDKMVQTVDDNRYLPDLQLMQRNARRLLKEVNQMLDFRKIENEKMELHKRTGNLVTFAEDLKCYFDGIARDRHIRYSLEVEGHKSSVLLAFDPLLLDKVLVNLLSNAFKFTPDGGKISIRIKEETDSVCITITDSGCGIPAAELPYVFERFFTNNTATGTGIGLHLAAEIVQLHGGRIHAESRENEFTRFIIELPKTESEPMPEPAMTNLSEIPAIDDNEIKSVIGKSYPYTVLVVEDDAEIREYLMRELSASFRVETAANGRQALDILNEKEISLIVSDVMMPEMNGYELCNNVKNDIRYSHLPFVLLTALASDKERLYGTVTGADSYIAKPFSADFLKVQIIRLLTTQQQYRELLLKRVVESNRNATLTSTPAESMEDMFLRKLIGFLEEGYADSEYNVERLSDLMGMSRGHLYRKVKELTGDTPVDFLRRFRLDKAAALLREKRYSVSEICYMTGFSSPAYFSKCFKTAFGATPSEYK